MSDSLFFFIYFVFLIMPAVAKLLTTIVSKKDIDQFEKAKKRRNIYRICFIIIFIPIIILIILFAIQIYENRNSTVFGENSGISYPSQEKEQSNEIFKSFEGKRLGSQIDIVLQIAESFPDNFENEPELVPRILFYEIQDENGETSILDSEAIYENVGQSTQYVETIEKIREKIDNNQFYYITCEYNENLVEKVIISHISNTGKYKAESIKSISRDVLSIE